MSKAKSYLLNISLILVSAFANFMLFLEAYKKLSIPFMNEEQRVENAPLLFIYVLPSFIFLSVIVLFLYKKLLKNQKNNA
ncbi:hypothetical protein AOG27_02505 [Pseudoalteromonas lipolytica]|uniref:Uncharacterized protein n=1 Tax=Pseudoalteromonas lipolytica TaxID=570156 RepID=A0A0P7D7U0_9GAMM|nr:hypothetical protein AOG27_02505 [Pseudoalteromonas lipolytica]